jgi:hypothetical protein
MRLSIKIIVGAAIVAASVAAATLSASAPAAASESVRTPEAAADLSARKKSAKPRNGTALRVSKLSRRAADPPNPDRPYYRPVPHFYPFAQDRGYF